MRIRAAAHDLFASLYARVYKSPACLKRVVVRVNLDHNLISTAGRGGRGSLGGASVHVDANTTRGIARIARVDRACVAVIAVSSAGALGLLVGDRALRGYAASP